MANDNKVIPWKPTDWVIAVDPGLMTGYSAWSAARGFLPDRSGQLPWLDFEDWLWQQLKEIKGLNQTCHVQSEAFTISARTIKTAVQYESLYVNGATQWMCRALGFTHDFSKPEQVMQLFNDNALRSLGYYMKGKQHQHDSARHLGFVLLQRGVIESRNWTKQQTEIE